MVRALGPGAHEGVDLGVGVDACAGRELRPEVGIERPLRKELARQAHRGAHLLAVAFGGHVVEQDRGRLPRVGRAQADPADRGRAHRPDVRLKAVGLLRIAAVVVHRDRQEMVLQIGMLDARARADEGARLEVAGRAEPPFQQDPLQADARLVPGPLRRVQRDRLGARVLDVDLQMVLEIAADARQVRHRRDLEPFELVGVADAGQHQQLRRVDRAAGEDHLALGADARGAPALDMIDADCAGALAAHSLRQRAGAHGQVRPAPGRIQVRARRAPAASAPDRHVHRREPLLLVAVHVGGQRIAGLAPRLDEGLVKGIATGAGRDVQRSVAAPIVVAAARAGLGALEIGQDVRVVPARQPALRPAIVVAGVAAHVGHPVDRGRAAEHPAARAVDAPAVHVRFGLAPVTPVVALALERIRERRRHVQLPGPRVVDRPRLE